MIFRTLAAISVILFFAGYLAPAEAQVEPDTQKIKPVILPDSLKMDTTYSFEEKDSIVIDPWKFRKDLEYLSTSNDSLLRWQFWPNWLYKLNRESGVITYRRGRLLRTEGLVQNAHETRHHQLLWENFQMGDPVTSSINWNFIPHHKISYLNEAAAGINHRSNFTLRQYYVNKPESHFNYDESHFQFQNLEFMVTQNFSRKTNAELSYWLRRDGKNYPRDLSKGSQIYGSVYHYLDNRRMLKATFIHNGYDLQMPFGYRMNNMGTFPFNRFNAVPVEQSASTDVNGSYLNVGYSQRDKSSSPGNVQANLLLSSNSRNLQYSSDTTNYKIRSARANIQRWISGEWYTVEGQLKASHYIDGTNNFNVLNRKNWSRGEVSASVSIHPISVVDLDLTARGYGRSDQYFGYSATGRLDLEPFKGLTMTADAGMGYQLPTIQQLYWTSRQYSGNDNLNRERILSAGGSATTEIFTGMQLGVKGRLKNIEQGIMLDMLSNNRFRNIDIYQSAMGSVFGEYRSERLELNASTTLHTYRSNSADPLVQQIVAGPPRLWMKGSAFIKGPVIDRAAYVKAGIFGILSPNAYRASRYFPVLDIWQSANRSGPIPPYYRVDLDLHARVRTIIVHLRYENILDDIGQLGYFEAPGYPMPGRRFMLGLRVLFRN